MVFIHGLFSSGAVWDSMLGLLNEDDCVRGIGFERFEYPSPRFMMSLTRSVPDFDILAGSLKVFLDTELSHCSSIALVAHSQGGLIVQRFLAQTVSRGDAKELQRIKRVVLIACPNSGSDLLISIRRRAWFWRHSQERQLRPLSAPVAEANSLVMKAIVNARQIDSSQCPIRITAYAAESDGVVSRASAQATFPDVGVLPGDHESVIVPSGPGDTRYVRIREDLLESLRTGQTYEGVGPKTDAAHRAAMEDLSELVAELSIPDGSVLQPGAKFTKTWIIRNAGSVPWLGRSLRRIGGADAPGLIDAPEIVPIQDTQPGEEVRINIEMRAPTVAAFTTCMYKMVDSNGRLCFPRRYSVGLSTTIQVLQNASDGGSGHGDSR